MNRLTEYRWNRDFGMVKLASHSPVGGSTGYYKKSDVDTRLSVATKNKIAVIALRRDYEHLCYVCNIRVNNAMFHHAYDLRSAQQGQQFSGLIFVGDYRKLPDLPQLANAVRLRLPPDGD